MAVAHYVCALGWLAKRKTLKCEICGQMVANIRAADIILFAPEATHLNVNANANANANAAGANNNIAHPFSSTIAQRCWSSLHEPKKAIIVAAALLGLHIISLPCALLVAIKAKRLRWDKDKWWYLS
eukprot:jgi/Chlat1/9298/Chrsp99S08548